MLCIFTIVFLFIIRCQFPKLKSLSKVVHFCYGNYELKFFRKFKKLNYRVHKINVDIEFLKSCLENVRSTLQNSKLPNSYENTVKDFFPL